MGTTGKPCEIFSSKTLKAPYSDAIIVRGLYTVKSSSVLFLPALSTVSSRLAYHVGFEARAFTLREQGRYF